MSDIQDPKTIEQKPAALPAPAPFRKDLETTQGMEWSLLQRKATALAASSLVPEIYQKNVPNVLIALDMADRLGANPLMVMQNLVIIHGKPTWSATFLIATVNQCGRFTPLRYETRGDDPRKPDFRCRAVARDIASGDVCEGEWIDWQMVDGEGWSKKSGSKWKTMPGQMFRYRAASFWARTFAPEVSMGIYTEDEARDVAAPSIDTELALSPAMRLQRVMAGPAFDAETGEIAEPETAPESTQQTAAPEAAAKTETPASAPKPDDKPACKCCGRTNYKEGNGDPSCEICQGVKPEGKLL